MNPGRLNHRVTIQRHTSNEDEHGITKETWIDLKTLWCSMNNLHGKEYWRAKEYDAENTIEFVIRYGSCKDLSIKDRLQIGGALYNITSIDNVLYKNETLKIKALEVM